MKTGNFSRNLAYFLSFFVILLGWVFAILLYTAYDSARTMDDWIPVLVSELLLPIIAFLVPAVTGGWWILTRPKIRGEKAPPHRVRTAGLVIGIVTMILIAPPLWQSARLHIPAETAFTETWGTSWESKVARPAEGPWHDTPWSLWNLFFGTPIDPSLYTVTYDIPYEILDEKNTLHVDIYQPTWIEGPIPLIINIHGGSWIHGDKGYFNIAPTSCYLAAQGYLVCDIQYGAVDEANIEDQSNIIQEIAHIADFTRWISDEAQVNTYHPDLDNVFVMGRSAGAHLAAVTVLSAHNAIWPSYGVNFSSTIKLRGGILYYPPVDLTDPEYEYALQKEGVTTGMAVSDLALVSPIKLLSSASLPLLILQGDVDTLVRPEKTRAFHQVCRSLSIKSVYLEFPLAEHAFDAVPGAIPTQISQWASERFLQLAMQEGI